MKVVCKSNKIGKSLIQLKNRLETLLESSQEISGLLETVNNNNECFVADNQLDS